MAKKLIAVASAPVKAIVSGEHGVVHGTPAITMTFEPYNKVFLYEEDGEPCIELLSERGSATLNLEGTIVSGKNEVEFAPFAAMVKKMISSFGLHPRKKLIAELESAAAPKGMGNSASIAAALATVLFHAMERTPLKAQEPEHDDLWMLVQSAEEVAHGGKPSGIDAMSVSYGPTKLQRIASDGKIVWQFEGKPSVTPPKGSKFILVDTHLSGERAKTGEMIKVFAKNSGLLKETGEVKGLLELSQADKEKLSEFVRVFEEISAELHEKGDARKLGFALTKNHLLLSSAGVSTREIEEVIKLASLNGAYGAKLTGAGGAGGAVLVLAPENDGNLVEALQEKGYRVFEAKSVSHGVRLEKSAVPAHPHVSQLKAAHGKA